MTVKKLIKELKKEKPSLAVRLFCQDHDPENSGEGVGPVFSVNEYTNDKGYTFVAIST